MHLYNKYEKSYIYTAFSNETRDIVMPYLEFLEKNNVLFWYKDSFSKKEEKNISCASAVLLFVNKEFLYDDRFHHIVNHAVFCEKNILCVYLEECELDSWGKMQLGTQQALYLYNYKSQDEFLSKLKESFIFQNMKVTKGKKRHKEISLSY